MISLKNRSFLKLLDFTPEEISYLLDLAAELKVKKEKGIPHRLCEGKNIALIFEKTSTRTRCSFEVAAADLGMHSVYLDSAGSQIGKREHCRYGTRIGTHVRRNRIPRFCSVPCGRSGKVFGSSCMERSN